MTRLLAFLILLLPLQAAGAEVGDTDAMAIRGVIAEQLTAFQADDGNAAFAHAAPVIRQKFADPQTFMQMVQSGYDPVYRPSEVEFQGLELQGDSVIQKVLFVDRNGRAFLARYTMQRMSDGSWKIAGVWLEELPDLST